MTRRGPAVAPVPAFRGRGGDMSLQSLCGPQSECVGGTGMGALTGDFGVEERKQEKGLALFCARPATSARSADSFQR